MEKPPRLKVDTELVVSDDQTESAANSAPTTNGISKATHSGSIKSRVVNKSGQNQTLVKALSTYAREGTLERDAKKQAEQEFLAAYKEREVAVRMRLVGVSIAIMLILFFCPLKIFDSEHKVAQAMKDFGRVLIAGMLGESDKAYEGVAYYSAPNSAEQLNNRIAIIDNAIANMEKQGQPAIFTRLGTQGLLIYEGQRNRGLSYGDFLIKKYPELPSNYCWRANDDANRGNYSEAIDEYYKFLAVLKKAPENTLKGWLSQLQPAIAVCVESGHIKDAENFLESYRELGASPTTVQSLKIGILQSQYEQLDVVDLKKTKFWNSNLDRFSKDLKSKTNKLLKVNLPANRRSELLTINMDKYGQNLPSPGKKAMPFSALNFYKTEYRARAAEATQEQNDAEKVLKSKTLRPNQVSTPLLYLSQAQAYLHLNKLSRAISLADEGVQCYQDAGKKAGKFYLSLLLVKANALQGLNKTEQSLALCDEIIAANPHMIAPRLLKIEIFESQNKAEEALQEQEKLASELKTLVPSEASELKTLVPAEASE